MGASQCCAAPPNGSEDSAVEVRPKVTWVSFSIRAAPAIGSLLPSESLSNKLKRLEKNGCSAGISWTKG
jgi:hypothetical protein